MKKLIIISLSLIAVILVSGCIDKEIDTGVGDCRSITTGLVGAFTTGFVEMECSNQCQAEGYSYKQWKCSSRDTIVCVCRYS